ncbi:hypothetical protein [Neoaquamicrobium sediminum]|uniref:TIGR02588 family protein n=1 Tax=Neoaquamicrobium sediminum TaxID=1849104 RepID=A0ABV3WZX2_9HYPH
MNGKENKHRNGRPALEWIVGVISAIVVLGILAFLSYEALFGEVRPPDLLATIDSTEDVEGGTLVLVTLMNRGDQAAAEITVEATGTHVSRKELRFDYIPSHAVRRGAFLVEGPADTAKDLRLRIHGYVEP